ncbi:hypothetical protein BZA05DRAFT_427833 [Tricharina praecox]|uniref:uncharacterized protein n=1 Tax=Tricharina praecox TaxID=43433 RepID=UPI0022211CB2|nr:uncharacterized protein BZA05DRAFT_427833 [Tricharina praecox]KAI5858354.1 hypothetical protein BZA05DRAFT_427833 [Tricharina praecox]
MWLLGCDDKDTLNGTRIWLRPGTRCVLGRVKCDDVTAVVPSSRSISRRHLVINVGPVNEGDGIKLHARTELTIQDCDTKHGTIWNGKKIKGTVALDTRDEHGFYLGKHGCAFRVKWTPVIFSVSLSSKERKDKNSMAVYRSQLEKLDIKTIATWTDGTTHVIAAKRNTAIGLQALVNGRHIVTHSYIDAIVSAAQLPPTDNGQTPQSSLECDFDAHWPTAEDFLPPVGYEPVSQPPEAYAPDGRRKNIFEGWVFVFGDEVQYHNLLAPITDAGGKPEKFTIKDGVTLPEELADFVQKRRLGDDIAVVRFRSKTNPDWEMRFTQKLQQLLGFRVVEQNEFLEVILSCDTSTLHRPLQQQQSPRQRSPEPPTPSNRAKPEPESAKKPAPSEGPAATRTRARVRRRGATPIDPFAFDVGGDFVAPTPEPASQIPTQSPESRRDQPIFSNDNLGKQSSFNRLIPTPMEMEQDEPSSSIADSIIVGSQPPSRKRPAPAAPAVPDRDENLDMMDLLPGARIAKRRKVAEEEERARRGETISPQESIAVDESAASQVSVKAEPKTPAKMKKRGKPETTFEVQAREIREKEAAEAERVKVEEQRAMEGVDIAGLKNLAIVETVEVKPRVNRSFRAASGEGSDRWKPEWNGRENFKGFRRSGTGSSTRSFNGPKILIDLVEHKHRDFGIGDGYWIGDEDSGSSRRKGTQRSTQQAEEIIPSPPRRGGAGAFSTAREPAEADQSDPDSPPTFSLRNRRGGTTSQAQTPQPHHRNSSALPSMSQSQTQAGTKRPVPPQASSRVPPAKKPKTALKIGSDAESDSDDSDDDGLRFKLRRRR